MHNHDQKGLHAVGELAPAGMRPDCSATAIPTQSAHGQSAEIHSLIGGPDPAGLDAVQSQMDTQFSAGERSAGRDPEHVRKTAATGFQGSAKALPHADRLQQAFGPDVDLGGVEAYVGGAASAACRQMGAKAYTSGNRIAFRDAPTLDLAAHEAAHVVQQQRGVQLKSGVGTVGDAYERNADAVAKRVGSGTSDRAQSDELHGLLRGAGLPQSGPNGAGVQMQGDGGGTTATINASVLNVRSRPSSRGAKVGALRGGTSVSVLGEAGSWLRIDYEGKEAFIYGKYADITQEALQPEEVISVAVITASGLNVRSRPSSKGSKVGLLSRGTEVEVIEQVGNWLCIHFGDDQAYVYGKYTKIEQRTCDEAPAEPAEEQAPPEQKPAEPKPAQQTPDPKDADDSAANVGGAGGELADLMASESLSPEQLERARQLIAEEPEARRGDLFEALQAKPAYRTQRDNESRSRGSGSESNASQNNMCNLTSLAMCLSYLGVPNPHSDMQYEDALEKVRIDQGFGARTTYDGWGKVAGHLGASCKFLTSGSAAHAESWWVANVLTVLRAGSAVMMSISGHIVRVQGVGQDGLMVDDPYGKCDLKPGEGRKWVSYNKKSEHSTAGEDVVWPWSQVESHTMRWVCSFSI